MSDEQVPTAATFSPFKPVPARGLRRFLRDAAGRFKAWTLRAALAEDAVFTKHLRRLPDRLFAFNTTICNARCTFCPYTLHQDKKEVMSLEVFTRAIEQFGSFKGVRLTLNPNNGDPLVDPGFVEKARAARAAGVPFIDLNTNGILLSRGTLAAELVEVVDRVGISLPGLDPEDYKRVYGVDKAAEVLAGIRKIAEAKRQAGSKVSIELDLRIDRTLDEVMADEGMVSLKPYLDDGTIWINYNQIYSEMETWSDQITQEQLPGTMILRTDVPERPRPCKRMMSDVALLADGKIRVCACRYHTTNYDELVVGDTAVQPLGDIVFGSAHRALLSRTAAGDWPKVCQDCTLYQPQDYPRATWLTMAWNVARSRLGW